MPSGNPQPPRGYRVMEERFAMAGDPRWQQGVAPEREEPVMTVSAIQIARQITAISDAIDIARKGGWTDLQQTLGEALAQAVNRQARLYNSAVEGDSE